MEEVTHQSILERVPEERPNPETARWVETINRHKETGEEGYFYLADDKALRQFAELIGHSAISSDQVLGYAYKATADNLERQGTKYKFDEEMSIIKLQERLGDFGTSLDFVNDFKVKLYIALDNEAMIYYEYESIEWVEVCDDCRQLEEYRELIEYQHPCEHGDYETSVNNSAHIMRRLGRKAIVADGLLEFY